MSNVPVLGGGGGTDRVLQFTRDFGAVPAVANWALLRWNQSPIRYSALVKLRVESLDATGGLVHTSFYHMYLSINDTTGVHNINMLAYGNPSNRGAQSISVAGNTAVGAQVSLVYRNKSEAASVTQWRITARIDETATNYQVDDLTIQSIVTTNQRAIWNDGDPLKVVSLGDLKNVDDTGVS